MIIQQDKLIKMGIIIIICAVLAIFFSSCSRHIYEGKTKNNCGAWQLKHFKF